MISMQVYGINEVVAALAGFPARLYDRLYTKMSLLGFDLRDIITANLTGKVLQTRTGRLLAAQSVRVRDTGVRDTSISLEASFNTAAAPYGVWQEFGISKSWFIAVKNAKALRYEMPYRSGNFAFAPYVTHHGLPERSFLRSALRELQPQILPAIEAAVAEAVPR